MKTPYLDEMINELDGYIGSSDNYLSKKANEKLTELKAIKKQLLLYSVVGRSKQLLCCCELLPIGKEVTLVDSEEMSYYSGKKTTIKGYTDYLGELHYKTGLEGIFTIEDFVR